MPTCLRHSTNVISQVLNLLVLRVTSVSLFGYKAPPQDKCHFAVEHTHSASRFSEEVAPKIHFKAGANCLNLAG